MNKRKKIFLLASLTLGLMANSSTANAAATLGPCTNLGPAQLSSVTYFQSNASTGSGLITLNGFVVPGSGEGLCAIFSLTDAEEIMATSALSSLRRSSENLSFSVTNGQLTTRITPK